MNAPLPEAYGRVTNPERFEALLPVALDLLDRLGANYRTSRQEGDDVDPDLVVSIPSGADRIVRIAPTVGGGAPLVVAFTSFPGLRVRFGRWHTEGFPVCGCDACDEQPDELADDFLTKVDTLTAGGFAERLSLLRRPGLAYTFGHGSGWSRRPRRSALRLGVPRSISWPAWVPAK